MSGSFVSATILTDASNAKNGALLKVIFADPGSGWTSAFTASKDPSVWPVVYVGSAVPNNTINVMGNSTDGPTFESSPALNGSNLEMTVRLTGYVYSGESSVTVSVSSGFITDSLGNTSGSTSSSAVTNNSTKTADSAISRMQGSPIVAWAIRDHWPYTGTAYGDVPSNRIRVAFDAVDFNAGIEYVELTFSYSATVDTSSEVTSLGSNVYRISSKRLCDIYGYGLSLDYWYLDVNISSVSDGTQGTVSITKIRTKDGVDHNPSSSHLYGGRVLPSYTLVVRKSPTIRYLDASATGSANGTSWANAWTDLSVAEAAVTTSIDEVRIAPGTYSESGISFDQSRSSRFVKWIYDSSGPSGAGTVTFALSGTTNFKAFNAFNGITFSVATNGSLRIASTSYISFENCDIVFYDKLNASNMSFAGSSHLSFIYTSQTGGYRGPVFGQVSSTIGQNILIHNSEIINSGTGANGLFLNCLIEGYTAKNCAGSDYPSGTHFDFLHPFSVIVLSGAGWTDSTKQITKTAAFSNLVAMFDDEMCSINITSGTGVTSGEYKILSALNDSITMINDINSTGGDISNASVGGSIHTASWENFIIRHCNAYDNGQNGGCNYNFALLETTGYNVAIYNNIGYSYQSSQQILQIAGNPRNVQIVSNTFLAIDNDSQSDGRGITLSGSICPNPYDQIGLLVVNNVVPSFAGSLGGHFSGNVPNLYYRKRFYSGNITLNQSPTNTVVNGSTVLSSGGLSTLKLVDIATVGDYDFSPQTTSPILGSATLSYATRDYIGNLLSIDSSAKPSSGAVQPTPSISVTYDGSAISNGSNITKTNGTKSLVISANGFSGSVSYISDIIFSGVTATDPSPVTLTKNGSSSSSTISVTQNSSGTISIYWGLEDVFSFTINSGSVTGDYGNLIYYISESQQI